VLRLLNYSFGYELQEKAENYPNLTTTLNVATLYELMNLIGLKSFRIL
jgi:hypothetical protein